MNVIVVVMLMAFAECFASRVGRRQRRSAFAPVFSGLYFDMKHRSGKMIDLAQENRRLLANISQAVQFTALLGAQLSHNVASMAQVGRCYF